MSHTPTAGTGEFDHGPARPSFLDSLSLIAANKKLIIGVTFAASVAAAGVSMLLPNVYTATAQILPPQTQSPTSALLGQISALSGAVGQSLGVKNPNDTYVAMLNSRTVADNLISRFELMKVYDRDFQSDTRKELAMNTSVYSGKDGIISVQVDDEEPKRAAALANGYIEELQKLTQTLAVTEASQRRLFFEKQLDNAKQALANAEVALKGVQEKTGLIQLTGQTEGIIRSAAEIKAQIATKEVMLGSMRTFATANNPDYIRIQQELVGLRAQLKKVEQGLNAGGGDISIPTSKVPEVGLDYVRKVRDVKYNETIFELLAKQFELAKIDEAKQSSLIQVLDTAVEPDRKSRPGRSLIVIMTAVAALVLSIAYVFARAYFSALGADEREKARLDKLKRSLRWK
ncbi:GumC family protein [Massilia sp. BHUDP2]|uniref:GumC family protein n=1 Tax=Massilia sp. BHUDP2 TaxID=3034505 RepID=UPI0039059470